MDELDVKDVFDQLVAARPPMPTSLDRGAVLQTGHQALRRRRAVRTGAGSALVAAALTAGVVAGPALLGIRRPGGEPTAAGPSTPARPVPGRSTTPATPAPASGTVLAEAEKCRPPAGSIPQAPPGTSAARASLPSARSVGAAVVAAARHIAPGARVTEVHAWDEARSPKTEEPVVAVWFDVTDRNGAGGMDFEIYPFRGVSPARLADAIRTERPYLNCTPAERRTEPDGSAGLVYPKPIGEYARYPNYVWNVASYFSATGVELNVRSVPFAESAVFAAEQRNPDQGVPNPPASRRTLPLSPQQLYELARVVGSLPVDR
jgi:hypothetical protein